MSKYSNRRFCRKFVSIFISFSLAGSLAFAFANKVGKQLDNGNSYNDSDSSYTVSEELDDYLMQTEKGVYVKLPIDNENPINIVMQNISNEDKTKVINAIKDLDDVSTNINYNILDSDDLKIKNKIYITDRETSTNALGNTNMMYNVETGEIYYPLFINIDMDACHKYMSDVTEEDAITAVTKHELGHTLGFKDIYDENLKDDTLMWYFLYGEDYTTSDEERFRLYYGGVEEDTFDRYEKYYKNIDSTNENYNQTNANFVVGEGMSEKQVAMKVARENRISTVYEPKYLVVAYEPEKDKKSKKELDNNKKSKEIEIEREL